MAAQDPTTNFNWDQPDVGADTGAWGGILNAVIGRWLDDGEGGLAVPGATTVADLDTSLSNDFSSAPVEPAAGSELALYLGNYDSLKDAAANTDSSSSGVPPGIDQTAHLLQKSLDLAEWLVLDIANRVTTLEASDPPQLAGRLSMSASQSISKNSGAQVVNWGTADVNIGNVADDASKLVVPVDGSGLWQIHAQIEMDHYSKNDDGKFVTIYIAKDNEIIAISRVPATSNGADSSLSGNITVEASVIDVVTVAEEGAEFTVLAEWGDINSGGGGDPIVNGTGSFFWATRITKEQPD